MTANPNWREIQEALLSKQSAANRPDVVARVFEIKRNALMADSIKMHLKKKMLPICLPLSLKNRICPICSS